MLLSENLKPHNGYRRAGCVHSIKPHPSFQSQGIVKLVNVNSGALKTLAGFQKRSNVNIFAQFDFAH